MKKLVLVALAAMVAMTASGCIITSGDDDPIDEFATITAKWSIKNIASNNNNLPCPPGTTTAALYNQVIDDNGNLVGSPAIDLFDCDDFQGAATDLDPDIYQSWVELTSDGGGTVYAQSLSAIVDVIDVDKTFETTILEDGGYFELSWNLMDANGGGPLTCAQAGATGVGILTTLTSGGAGIDDLLPCAPGYGVTGGLLMGSYTVQVSAVDSVNEGLGEGILKNAQLIDDRNAVTDLGSFTLPID
jgi:hypothetical protein